MIFFFFFFKVAHQPGQYKNFDLCVYMHVDTIVNSRLVSHHSPKSLKFVKYILKASYFNYCQLIFRLEYSKKFNSKYHYTTIVVETKEFFLFCFGVLLFSNIMVFDTSVTLVFMVNCLLRFWSLPLLKYPASVFDVNI